MVRIGEPGPGNAILQTLGAGEAYGASKGLSIFHTICGDIDLAADWYEKAIEERDSFAVAYLQAAIGDPLRASPYWPKLVTLMNLPAAPGTLAT